MRACVCVFGNTCVLAADFEQRLSFILFIVVIVCLTIYFTRDGGPAKGSRRTCTQRWDLLGFAACCNFDCAIRVAGGGGWGRSDQPGPFRRLPEFKHEPGLLLYEPLEDLLQWELRLVPSKQLLFA